MSRVLGCLALWVVLAALPSVSMSASPLVQPGDYRFRHDITLLRDAGLLRGPVTMWPVSLPQLASELDAEEVDPGTLTPAVRGAWRRVQHRLRRARGGGFGTEVSLRAASETPFLRSFDDAPRGELEAGVGMHWTGDRFAGELHLTRVEDDPVDNKEWRLDGSWAGVRLGNWMLAAGKMQRSWGPAWQGSLIVSNNARPRPGVTLRRMRADPFETKWLSWLGPWQFTTFVERLEGSRGVPNALLWGARFGFRPFESLEVGLSRTTMFGGQGNDIGWDTVANILTGQTTSTNLAAGGDDAFDQMAGFDLRWDIPYVNAAFYGEMIGEDESGSRPNLMLGQGGFEFWGGLADGGGSWRLILERADTKADVLDSSEREGDEEFGIAYNNGAFPTGHRYRGRVMGHPAEGDATLSSARLLLSFDDSSFFNLAYLRGNLNRAAGVDPRASRNTLTTRNEDVRQMQLSWKKQYRFGRVELGIGRTEREPVGGGSPSTDGFAWVGFDRQF